ncbi:hypothetical protein UFOVP275_70 [uncultured Caudovirales phage]|uniref:RsaL-like HTH domain-containing protein n=1 Tax=uncultured Caudovirales phage TaxID=2100421 RepID=A0A6J5LPZ7_9CAUD|nr:hypothetical protein UFOVP275_70 [uncultured Caudovirales phage]
MQITEDEITGLAAKQIRQKLGLTQAQFWKPLRVTQSVGSRYEQAWMGVEIPAPVKTLLIATHIAGMTIDATSDAGVADLVRMGMMQRKFKEAKTLAKKVIKDLEGAESGINKARTALQTI